MKTRLIKIFFFHFEYLYNLTYYLELKRKNYENKVFDKKKKKSESLLKVDIF